MRQVVELSRAYRLLNHGPTVLVSAAHEGRRNLMAAAWVMPLDFDPPKVAVVIDKSTFTRGLVERSGRFALNVPCRDQADLVFTVGSCSGADGDKFDRFNIASFPGTSAALPLVAGCVAWLECTLLPEPHIASAYDLLLGNVVAAQADGRVFRDGRWHFAAEHQGLRTLHHLAGGGFFSVADPLQATMLPG